MISLLAPYGRTEVTAAAVRLAELAASLGHAVRFVACGARETNVHPRWDHQVVCGDRAHAISRAALKSQAVVHFQCHQAWHDKVALTTTAKSRPKQILVPNWHGMSTRQLCLVPRFDQIVCPSKLCRRVLAADVFRGEKLKRDRLTYATWDSGLPPVRREGTIEDGQIRACLYCDASAADVPNVFVPRLADSLLKAYPRLRLSVVGLRGWDRDTRVALGHVVAAWDGRLEVRRLPNWPALTREFHAHDWAVLPSARSDYSLAAGYALACGTPVICHGVSPFTEVVSACSGLLVPCSTVRSDANAPLAVPDVKKWVETCRQAFRDTSTLFSLQTNDWRLKQARTAFDNVWRTALEL